MIKGMLLLIFAFVFFCSIQFYRESNSERDHMSFKSSVLTVEKAITEMNKLIYKLEINNDDITNFILIDNNNLFINSKQIGIIDKINTDSIYELNIFTKSEKKQFLCLIKLLAKYEIKSCYLDKSSRVILYDFKRNIDGSNTSSRKIYLDEKNKDYSIILSTCRIIDKQDNLVLIKSK